MRDLTGKRFGRLHVIKRVENDKNGRCVWLCRCDCGNELAVKSAYLTSGEKRSCGCLQKEVNSAVHTKHGMRKERLYRIWQGMKTRCLNKKHINFQHYGGCGISVCPEWNDFWPFYEWSITHGYSTDLTIDRIDNEGNYCPSNCRWATCLEQTRNRKNTIKIKYQGTERTLMEIAQYEGITYQQAYRKYRKM